jgi:hypothetical protein
MTMRTSIGLAVLVASTADAQSLASRIKSAPDGEVRIAFAAREGICGDGESFIRDRNHGPGNYITFNNGNGSRRWRERECLEGPVRVALRVRGGDVRSARTYVGGDWRDADRSVTDLELVSAKRAAEALIELARTGATDDVIFAATIADSVTIWPALLTLAKDREVNRSNRKQAVFWLSQAAGDRAAEGLEDLVDDDDEDREVREQAVFALSQLPKDEGVPILLRTAKSNRDPSIRKKAMFWLGQSDDPRALALFEEILSKP